MQELYSQYLSERLGYKTLYDKEGRGFVTYHIAKDGEGKLALDVLEIYVHPDFRRSKVAKEMMDEIRGIALKEGCSRIFGQVALGTNGATNSLKFILSLGSQLYATTKDTIILVIDLEV